MKHPFIFTTALLMGAVTNQHAFAQDAALKTPENIALGAPVTFDKSPSYALSTDPEDKLQLTDGKFVEGYFWAQKGTVGWQNAAPVITLDLGKVQPISGVMVSTAAGRAGVNWPSSIFLGVSEDGKSWSFVGNLIHLSRQEGQVQPAPDVYNTFRYVTHGLKTKGRYVAVVPLQQPYAFLDEIEVYRGDDSLLQKPAGTVMAGTVQQFVQSQRSHAAMINRLAQDLASVRGELQQANVPAARKKELSAQLDAAQREIETASPIDSATFKTIIPQNATHAKILAVHGEILGARLPALTAWKKHRYAWQELLEAPQAAPQAPPSLDIEMLGNEFRADAFSLTNASGKDATATLKVLAAPSGAQDGWLQVSPAAWTDTLENVPVAGALPVVEPVNGAYPISIPAGLTRKVWLTVDASKLPAGTHKTSISVQSNGKTIVLPLALRVSSVKMNTPRLSLGMWDYTDTDYGALTSQNRAAAIKMMRSHYVDSPWAQASVLPWPQATAFDEQHQLKEPEKLDWKRFDDWVALWPGARHYMVFASIGSSFAGAKLGSEEFDGRVGSWAKVLANHMKALKLRPEQLALLLLDEPHSDEQDAIIAAWAKAINATTPELTLFQDPTWKEPQKTKIQEAITAVDIVSPLIMFHKEGGAPVEKYFQERRAAGQTLWFYQCQGPARLFSPNRYNRLQSWYAFDQGATGIGNWAFSDTGGTPSSWNEYLCTHNNYSPVFFSPTDVTDGIYWEAVREGVQDYEYLAMLRDAAAKSKDQALKTQAASLLKSAARVVQDWDSDYDWKKEDNPQWADDERVKIISLLEKLNA